MHRVVVTGLGMVNSLGADATTCWERLKAGENGIRRISFWDPAAYQTKVAGEIRELPREVGLESYPGRYCRRNVRAFVPAAREALRTAGLDLQSGDSPIPARRIGLALGVSVNYLDMGLMPDYFRLRNPEKHALELSELLESGGDLRLHTFYRRQGETIASVSSRLLGIGGPALTNDTACAASAHSIGDAFRMIRRGDVTAMLAGGASALVSPLSILAFAIIGALSRQENPDEASRPFDRRRDGFVMGEGAGAMLLESLESAQSRGAQIFAELAGFGSSLNAYTLTDPSPDGQSEAAAMRAALADGALVPDEIGYVAAHGTSTPKNDSTETKALKSVFGSHARRLLVSSNKGQIGHTISAAGVSNAIFAVQAIRTGEIPPTMHLKEIDPECDLDYVPNQSRRVPVSAALANAFAFGGQNAVLAFRAWKN